MEQTAMAAVPGTRHAETAGGECLPSQIRLPKSVTRKIKEPGIRSENFFFALGVFLRVECLSEIVGGQRR
jgi:hypothetical protein